MRSKMFTDIPNSSNSSRPKAAYSDWLGVILPPGNPHFPSIGFPSFRLAIKTLSFLNIIPQTTAIILIQIYLILDAVQNY